ncbi:MAG: SIR2 family protein [Rhodoplanes sp.]|uniref:SIR2 family NAD-dependent protein deacylase n=1 Tax=Rhodoplanes sp. TaxID=1968906 RepID=UPI0017F1D8B0|nr:SIR2 family protein [Rhodoplanes sp.]NVO16707.1 SIR2 family protein [Rhodoplanes sp.]
MTSPQAITQTAVPTAETEELAPPAGRERLAGLAADLRAGKLVPYLGPDLLPDTTSVPRTPEALALALHARVAVSSRIRGNLWTTAQSIESRRHRTTLTALMAEIFRAAVPPTALHRALAALPLPLIVDTWYDGAMRAALVESGRTDWGEIQGITRAHQTDGNWSRTYDATGAEVDPAVAAGWTTVLYKPHGGVVPAQNFLVSDSDYVEVLTEIDIQTPIPPAVKERRSGRGFLFVGTRFHDQMLRIFAGQIAKRSGSGHAALVDSVMLTRNEARFLTTLGADPVAATADEFAALLG